MNRIYFATVAILLLTILVNLNSFAITDTQTLTFEEEEATERKAEGSKVEPEKLGEIIVTGEPPKYTTNVATTAKLDTPVIELAQSIDIITRNLLHDRVVTNLHDIWQNVASAYTPLGGDGYGNVINIRGFSSAHNLSQSIMFNGLRGGRGMFTIAPSLYNVQRVEVLKGPSSVLYGTMMPGGLVNIISRKPQSEPDNDFDVIVGSFDRLRFHLHSAGPTRAEKIFYLFDIGYERAPKLHKNMDKRNIQFISSLTWLPNESIRIDFESGITEDRRKSVPSHGIPVVDGDPFALPRDFNFTEPSDLTTRSSYYSEIRFNQKVSNALKVNAGLRGSHSNMETSYHVMSGTPSSDGTLKRMYSEASSEETPFSMDINATWNTDIGKSMKNKAVIGIDLASGKVKSSSVSATQGVPSINVFNPVYGKANPKTYTYGTPSEISAKDLHYGLYIQDGLEIINRLHILLGLRAEKFEQEVKDLVSKKEFTQDDSAVTFRGGVLYEIVRDTLSVFGSYSESYEPQFFDRVMLPTQKGFPWDPEESRQVESGIKGALKDQLNATLSWFSIEKTNILDADPDVPNYFRTIGSAKSEGVELNIIGTLIRNLNLLLNYSYLYKAEVTKDTDPKQVGTRLYGTWKHLGSVWLRYDVGPLGIGFGANYVAGRPPVTPMTGGNPIELPDYCRYDLAIYYSLNENARLQLNVENLFNKKYLAGARPTQGSPRNFTITAIKKF